MDQDYRNIIRSNPKHDSEGMYSVVDVDEHRFDVVQKSSGVTVVSAAGKQTASEAASALNACAIVPRIASLDRVEQLEAILRMTRRLVSNCAITGFVNDDDLQALYKNNGSITSLVPLRPEDREEGLKAIEARS